MYDAARAHPSQSQTCVFERILFSGSIEPTITHKICGEKPFLHLISELESFLTPGKGPTRYSSLSKWDTNEFLRCTKFSSKVCLLAIFFLFKCTEVQAEGPSKAPDFGSYYRPQHVGKSRFCRQVICNRE